MVYKPPCSQCLLTLEKRHEGENKKMDTDTKKQAIIKGKKFTFFDKLRRFVTKHDHTSILYRKNENTALTQSHLNRKVESEAFELSEYMYSNLFKINLLLL